MLTLVNSLEIWWLTYISRLVNAGKSRYIIWICIRYGETEKLFIWLIARLNSEDFSKFFLCLDILFLTYSDESTYLEVQKTAEIVSNICEYSWFFRLFRGFSYRTFYASGTQSRAMHQKIPHKIWRRTVFVRSLGSIGQKWFYTKNCSKMRFYAGLNCVGSLKTK